MSRPNYNLLKNSMILANGISNIAALAIITVIIYPRELQARFLGNSVFTGFDIGFTVGSFFLIGLLLFFLELPIRRYLDSLEKKRTPSPGEILKAKKRLLNYPFIVMALDLGIWLLAALFYSVLSNCLDFERIVYQHIVVGSVTTGLTTSVLAFFWVERISRRLLTPVLFPNGGLSAVPGTLRVRFRVRMIMLLAACNIVPFGTIMLVLLITPDNYLPPEQALEELVRVVLACSILFMGVGALLAFLTGLNLAKPFEEITEVLDRIRQGKFDRKVRVTSNDEIGYTGDRINEMAEGLREREKMRQSMALAMEVQKNLLPRKAPVVEGFDLAGTSIYCDETGGDYFDYLELDGKVGLVVGDVSGHGAASALLMATARGFLRQRADMGGRPREKVADVNRRLTRDVEDSGQFMTMFYAELDPVRSSITWVCAGHDPGIVYEPRGDYFEELGGRGPALALFDEFPFEERSRALEPGQVVVLGTDGVWETRDSSGLLFGKEALKKVIRDSAQLDARGILAAVIGALDAFSGTKDQEDDVTLLVFKVLAAGTGAL
ncbi:MAG: SpoIIE family protein phosphatase [Pseudomonadota bacterium]